MRSPIRRLSRLLLASVLFACSAATAAVAPVVIELFTSQGCSSCPPADALLGELARRPNVIALAYHVDYWDELGWKDRFAIPAATQRQRGYVSKLSKSGAFTPQVVVSGDTSLVGSNRAAVMQAVAGDRDALAVKLSKTRDELIVDLPEQWREPMDVHVASYLSEATTKIGSGENANRTLRHHHIVRSFKRLGVWSGRPQQMKLPVASLPRDATHVAVILQRPRQGAIAGAAKLAL